MYLTQFPVNTTRRETYSMLFNPYRMHAAIAGSFAAVQSSRNEGRILWRLDRDADGSVRLYIVSPTKPSLVGLDEQIGWPDLPPQWKTREYDSFLERVSTGEKYSFRLVANPVISRRSITNDKGRAKRIPHLTAVQQAAWLIGEEAYRGTGSDVPHEMLSTVDSRAIRNGFQVVEDSATNSPLLVVSDSRKFEFRKGMGKTRICLSTARFDGVLEVIDADLLRYSLTHGIGHGKGFGCGLLTLALLGRP